MREGVFASRVFVRLDEEQVGRFRQCLSRRSDSEFGSNIRSARVADGFDRDLAGQAARRRVAEPYDS